jgi:hypothetical protein
MDRSLATAIQLMEEETVESPEQNPRLRMMARWFFLTFWAIIATGAIRKWLFPSVKVLYLLQDVPILLAYGYALITGFFTRTYMLLGLGLMAVLILLQGLAQIVFGQLPIFVALVGFHNYLFYFPMLLIFPLCLTEKYRKDLVRWNLLLSLPMCLLALAQALSPKGAWVNKTSEGDAFGVPGADIARVSGTFNFIAFYGIWAGMAVAMCVGEWLLPKHRRVFKNTWLLILCTFTVNLCHLVSGSRSAIALAASSIVGAMVAAVVLGSNRAILAIGGICMFLPIAAGMTYLISPQEFTIVTERFTGEQYVDDNKNRLSESLFGFLTVPKFSMLGAGIGMGVDAAHAGNADTYMYTYNLSEEDMIRVVMELGTPVGLIYALGRIAFISGMILLAINITRSGSSPHVLPLAFICFAQTYIGDLTRAATMTSTQVMVGYAFILGAYYYPDNTGQDFEADELSMRSA